MSKKRGIRSSAKGLILKALKPYGIYQIPKDEKEKIEELKKSKGDLHLEVLSDKEEKELARLRENNGDFHLEIKADDEDAEGVRDYSVDKEELDELKDWLGNTEKERIWVFNSGNDGTDFRGNPKYLFTYVNYYRQDMKAVWVSNEDETVELIRSLGFKAYNIRSAAAGYLYNCAGVIADEQIRFNIPHRSDVKYLNMWHGWGYKPVERSRVDDDDDLRFVLCPKFIKHNTFFQNNQIVCVVNSLQEEYFSYQIGVGAENFLRAGYARCIYQKNYKPISTFNHDIFAEKGLPEDTKIAVYAPTFRKNRGNTFADALPDLEKLYKYCEESHTLFIFKMHPLMENETAFVAAKESMGDKPYFLFWDNRNDIYEIMHRVDLLIYDYSSIFSDFLLAGVKNYIRYIFDGDDMEAAAGMNSDEEYFNNSRGKICYTYDEFLDAFKNGDYVDEKDKGSIDDFINIQWEYAGDDDLDKIIDFTLRFEIKDTVYPTLYSFDIFDTLISRKGLNPDSIFYAMRDNMRRDEKLGFNKLFIERFPQRRYHAEFGVREYMNKSLEQRHTVKREVTLSMIYDEIQTLENLTDEQRDYLFNLECETEIDAVIPLEEGISTVKELLGKGEKVIFISDMYLPLEVIKKMLAKSDPVLAEVEIFLSNEYGTLKTNKFLFFEVYRSKKPFFNYGKWIHTGDDLNADQRQPRLLGIETRLVEKPEFSQIEELTAKNIGTYDAYKIMALQARMKKDYTFKSADFVIDYVAPLFVSYIDWVIRDAINKGFETLYFVSRDGHHLKRIADAIIKQRGLSIKTKYIYASRRVWRVPSFIDSVDEEFFAHFGGNFNDIHVKDKFLKAASFDSEEDFRKIFPHIDLDTIDFDDWTEGQPARELAVVLNSSEKYHQYLLDYGKSRRQIVCDYLLQEVNPNEKHAFVEFFGRGYNQTCHSRLWNYAINKEVPLYYYYSRALLPTEGNCVRYKMTSTNIQFFFIESIFANMPYKSIEEYKRTENGIVPVKTPIQCDKDLFNAMELLLPEYASRFAALDLDDCESLDKSLFDSLLIFYRENLSEPFIYKNIGTLVDAVSMFGEKRVFARPYTDEDIENFRNGIPRTRGTMSVTMSYMQSDPLIKLKYDELYQLEPGEDCAYGSLLRDADIEKSRDFTNRRKKLLENAREFTNLYYHACAETEVQKNKVLVLFNPKNVPDSLQSVVESLEASTVLESTNFSCNKLNADKMKELAVLAAESAFIVVNESVPVLSGLKLREESKMIVVESSAFKLSRKGFNAEKRIKSMKKYDTALYDLDISALTAPSAVSAEYTQKKYGIALGESQIINGSPVTDIYSDEEFRAAAREKLISLFPAAEGKKILLYLPDLRKMPNNDYYYNLLDIETLKEYIGDEYVVVIDTRNHKDLLDTVPNKLEIKGFSKLINSKISVRKLLVAADVIVGDYRDTLFESVLLNVPVFFSGYDYENRFRNVNFVLDYTKTSPFPIVKSAEELCDGLSELDSYDYAPHEEFKKQFLTYCDGESGKRVCEYIEKSI